MADQSTWPAHLRDDAPSQRCDRCFRFTWSEVDFNGECRMSQKWSAELGFHGPCGGTFRPVGGSTEMRLRLSEYGGGKFFGTRHLGGHIRAEAEKLLADLPDDGMLVLDFTGVQAVTVAFADELVANLTAVHGPRIALAGMGDEVGSTVQLALSRRADLP